MCALGVKGRKSENVGHRFFNKTPLLVMRKDFSTLHRLHRLHRLHVHYTVHSGVHANLIEGFWEINPKYTVTYVVKHRTKVVGVEM